MKILVQNVPIIASSAKAILTVRHVQWDIRLKSLNLKIKKYKYVFKSVVMALNIKMSVMMEITTMVMDVVILVEFNQDGLVREDHQQKKADVINISLIKLFLLKRVV